MKNGVVFCDHTHNVCRPAERTDIHPWLALIQQLRVVVVAAVDCCLL